MRHLAALLPLTIAVSSRAAGARQLVRMASSGVPSWASLKETLASRGRDYEAQRSQIVSGDAGPHTDAKVRLFGHSERDVRLTLYRDTAAWCPYVSSRPPPARRAPPRSCPVLTPAAPRPAPCRFRAPRARR